MATVNVGAGDSEDSGEASPLDEMCDMRTLYDKLHPARTEWFNIGLTLNLPIESLKEIDLLHKQDPKTCLCTMLTRRLDAGPLSWGEVCDCLRYPIVGRNNLAEAIEEWRKAFPIEMMGKKHSKTTPAQVPFPLSKVVTGHMHGPVNYHSSLDDQVDHLETSFQWLTNEAFRRMKISNVSVDDFYVAISNMKLSMKCLAKKYVEECFEKASTLPKIWGKLNHFWNFFNYELFQQVVRVMFTKADDPLLSQLAEYENEMKTFLCRTKLCDFVDHWPFSIAKPKKKAIKQLKRIFVTVDKKWEDCTLHDVKKTKTTFSVGFSLPQEFMVLKGAGTGSVSILLHAPPSLANSIEEQVKQGKDDFLADNGFLSITIDGVQVYPHTPMRQASLQVLTMETLKKETKFTDEQLDTRVEKTDLPQLSSYFDNIYDGYLEKLGLSSGQQTDVRSHAFVHGSQGGMLLALTYWLDRVVAEGTFRALLLILLSLGKEDVAIKVAQYLSAKGYSITTSELDAMEINTKEPIESKSDDQTINEHNAMIINILETKYNVDNDAAVLIKELTLEDNRDVTTKINKNNQLLLACKFGYTAVVRYLINKCDVDVDGAVTSDGLTPLGVAVREGHLDTIKYLIMDCNVDVSDSAQIVRILELTLKDEGDVTTKVNENNRLLLACKFGYTALVRYLINKCDVDVDGAVTSDGLTPLGVAVREGHLDTIMYLIMDCNVDVSGAVTSDGLTPLGVAVREGHLDTIKYLIMNCNVDVSDGILTDGALLLACKRSDAEFVEYLLNFVGCDPNIKDDDGQTPLFHAGSKEVILLLLQHGATAENAYSQHRKALGKVFSKDLLKNPVKILVIGHCGEGKSTLIEAMEHEPTALTSLVNIFFVSRKKVDGVSQKTAGIIPRLFKSRVFGDVLVYDFAGQEVYYSSHAAIIKSAVDACRPIIVLVLGLHKDDTYTTHSVSYWLGIIANQCANMEGKAPLIVVGSHADCLTDERKISRKEEIVLEAVSRYPTLDLLKFIPMDNRTPTLVA
ncbi:uncharacterized protein LOC135344400 isoform X3 [Halichondria panicea]|uniref:uncharacterized protein LOC135344400 isoform X3 n=1 Tax=Halichondria panicea TaxID=6063 RepID=UPI00312B8770